MLVFRCLESARTFYSDELEKARIQFDWAHVDEKKMWWLKEGKPFAKFDPQNKSLSRICCAKHVAQNTVRKALGAH